jgi:preprotein translocase subunit SecG
MTTFLLVLHFMVCFVLIVVVLLQRGKGADLGAALGGGGSNTLFGGRGAGNFLTRLTTASAIIFMVTSLSLAYFTSQQADVRLFEDSDLSEETGGESPLQETGTAPAAPAAESAPTGGLREIEIPAPEPSAP